MKLRAILALFRPGALANAAAAGLALAAGLARAADNDVVLDAIDVLCANPRGSIGETVKLVMRSPLQAREVAAEQKPYGREIYLAKLGATLTLLSKSSTAPVEQCVFVGYSDDMAGLAERMLKTFGLPEPAVREIDSWRVTKRKGRAPRPLTVEFEYGLQDNQKAGAFTLRIDR